MAKLPNAEKAIIETEKLRSYILSSVHPVGRFKAAFFQRMGYSADNWEAFEEAIRDLISVQDVSKSEMSQYGNKFVVEGPLIGLLGDPVQIVTVWIILNGEEVPQFISAYPGGLR